MFFFFQAEDGIRDLVRSRGSEMCIRDRDVESPVARVLREDVVVALANGTLLIARDGTERPITDSGAPVRDEQGVTTGVVLVFSDRTADRERRRAVEENERRLSTLMSNLQGMVYRCQNDRDWTMEFVSVGCRDLPGC